MTKFISKLCFFLSILPSLYGQEGSSVEQYFNVSISETERQNCKASIYDLSQQIKDDPENAFLYIMRGVSYATLGLHVDAINDYNKAIRLDSTIAEAYYNRGISRARFAFTKSSCIDIKKAAELGSGNAKVLYDDKCKTYIHSMGEIEE